MTMIRVMSETINTAMAVGFDQLKQKAVLIAMIRRMVHKKVFFILHSLTNVLRLFQDVGEVSFPCSCLLESV